MRNKNLKIIKDPDLISDVVFVKKSDPFFSYKLPVGDQRSYTIFAEEYKTDVDPAKSVDGGY